MTTMTLNHPIAVATQSLMLLLGTPNILYPQGTS